jgi:hypothetical protein
LAVGSIPLGGLALGTVALYRIADQIAQRIKENRIIAHVPRSDGTILTVLGKHLALAHLTTDVGGDVGWRLELAHLDGADTMRGENALNAVALVMPAINGTGAAAAKVNRAIKRLEGHADPLAYLRAAAAVSTHASRPGDAGSLLKLPVDMRMAIEMAANEENERFALEGDMALLEMDWEEAEEIAAIADNLTLLPEVVRQLEELRRETSTRQRGKP